MERFWEVFNGVRRVTIFVLGVFVTLDAIFFEGSYVIAKLIAGSLMSGVLPLENVFSWRHHKIETIEKGNRHA